MWILQLINNRDVIQLDIEVLIDALEGAADGDVVFELHCHRGVDQGFEEAARKEKSVSKGAGAQARGGNGQLRGGRCGCVVVVW